MYTMTESDKIYFENILEIMDYKQQNLSFSLNVLYKHKFISKKEYEKEIRKLKLNILNEK